MQAGLCQVKNSTSDCNVVRASYHIHGLSATDIASQLGYRPSKETAVLVNGHITSASNGNGSSMKQLNAAMRSEL